MAVSGQLFIGGERVSTPTTFLAMNPASGEAMQPPFSAADQAAVDKACALAWSAFDGFQEAGAHVTIELTETIECRPDHGVGR